MTNDCDKRKSVLNSNSIRLNRTIECRKDLITSAVKSLTLVPEMIKIPFKYENGKLTFRLDKYAAEYAEKRRKNRASKANEEPAVVTVETKED